MYHFVADHPPVPVRLSFRASIPGHVRQYLKQFQIDGIQFMHNFLAKGEFCCYNDESGLGKQAAVAVLLDAACSNKKTLIVVQNDDTYVSGWQFHFNVLTNASVMVIKENKDSTNTPHNVYIAKWSTLRAIDDLSKFDFDFIIVDNRGQMLNNSFCTSMLLKHYERKINILISSVDITSDLKLLHNILKISGRLDPRYASFKAFEDKFKLPDGKELAYKKVDLEDYFLRRERLADYCKHYRLRRYCHQFEQHLPLVPEDRYKINLEIWREKQSATNSEGSSVEVSTLARPKERIRDTQELFEEYCKQRRKLEEREKIKQEKLLKQQRELEQKEQEEKRLQAEKEQDENDLEVIYNVDDEVAMVNATPSDILSQPLACRDNTDEVLLMSPLLVVSDSEDPDDVPQICNDPNDDADIVDLSSEDERNDKNENSNKNVEKVRIVSEEHLNQIAEGNLSDEQCPVVKPKRRYNYVNEADKLRADVATNLKFQNETTPKRRTRHEEEVRHSSNTRRRALTETRLPKEEIKSDTTKSARRSVIKDIIERNSPLKKTKKEQDNQDSCKDTDSAEGNKKHVKAKAIDQEKKKFLVKQPETTEEVISKSSKNNKDNNENISSSRPKRCKNAPIIQDKMKSKENTADIVIKIEPEEESPPQNRRSDVKIMRLERIKRELDIDHVPLHNKETRSMQRSTRSNPLNSKYAYTNISLHSEKSTPKSKKKHQEKYRSNPQQNPKPKESKSEKDISDTQAAIISMTCSQDYEPIQCAQRLSDFGVSESITQRNDSEFLVPPTPALVTRNSLIPSSLTSSNGFFAESEVIFVPPSAPKGGGSSISAKKKQNEDVIILSGSETENTSSVHVTSTSRRTRALKPRRTQQPSEETSAKVPTFSQLLAQHNSRKTTKSPDLFSNCSDLGHLTLSQAVVNDEDEPNAPFEGFKIFGSEVKQMQQHYALSNTQHPTNASKKAYRDRSCLDILENMFEPKDKKGKSKDSNPKGVEPMSSNTTNSKKLTQKVRTQVPIVPQHPIEVITEAQAKNELKQKRCHGMPLNEDEIFEITSNGTFGSVMRLHSNGEISPVHQTQKNNKLSNKITKYFLGNGLTQTGSLTGSQDDSGNNSETGTPSKQRQQQQQANNHQQISSTQHINSKKSPRQKCHSTQTTKLTKWFTKNSPNKQQQVQVSSDNSLAKQTSTTGKRHVKRRRLDLTQVTDDTNCI